jgi:hypothetical protein
MKRMTVPLVVLLVGVALARQSGAQQQPQPQPPTDTAAAPVEAVSDSDESAAEAQGTEPANETAQPAPVAPPRPSPKEERKARQHQVDVAAKIAQVPSNQATTSLWWAFWVFVGIVSTKLFDGTRRRLPQWRYASPGLRRLFFWRRSSPVTPPSEDGTKEVAAIEQQPGAEVPATVQETSREDPAKENREVIKRLREQSATVDKLTGEVTKQKARAEKAEEDLKAKTVELRTCIIQRDNFETAKKAAEAEAGKYKELAATAVGERGAAQSDRTAAQQEATRLGGEVKRLDGLLRSANANVTMLQGQNTKIQKRADSMDSAFALAESLEKMQFAWQLAFEQSVADPSSSGVFLLATYMSLLQLLRSEMKQDELLKDLALINVRTVLERIGSAVGREEWRKALESIAPGTLQLSIDPSRQADFGQPSQERVVYSSLLNHMGSASSGPRRVDNRDVRLAPFYYDVRNGKAVGVN